MDIIIIAQAAAQAAENAAEQGNALIDAVSAAANFLPFPWNVVAASAATVAGALFAWHRKKQKTDNG